MADVLIRCDECKHLYTGDLEVAVNVYEVDATPMGGPAMKVSNSKHLCLACSETAASRK